MSALAAIRTTRLPKATAAKGLLRTEEAFRSFHGRTATALWAYVARSSSPQLAEDLVQEAYFRLLRADFEPKDESHARNYLFRIATNLLTDHYRKRGRRPEMTADPADEEIPAADIAVSDRVALEIDLSSALSDLSRRDRQLLWLAHVEGLSHAEIAAALEIKATSIRSMLFRARARLSETLRQRNEPPEVTP